MKKRHDGVGRAWVALALLAGGCSSEWVEKKVPGEPSDGPNGTTPERTYPMHIPSKEKVNEASAGKLEVPLGEQAVTIELPATRARHVKAGEKVDLYATLDPKRPAQEEEPEGSAKSPRAVGSVVMRDAKVGANTCGEDTCALTLFLTWVEKLELRSFSASGHVIHPWVHVEGSEALERRGVRTLRDELQDLEISLKTFRQHLEEPSKESRRVALEIDHSPMAVSLLSEGAVVEFAGTFGLDNAEGEFVTISLLQRVPVERARREGARVVVELVLPAEHAAMLAIARHDAVRIDTSVQHPDEEFHEAGNATSQEVLENLEVWTHTPRPPRRKKRNGPKRVVVTPGP